MGLISWIIWGAFVGAVARLVLPGRQAIGCLWTIAVGIAGSLTGGLIATQLFDVGELDEFSLGSFFIAVGASVVLLWIYERIAKRQAPVDGPRGPRG